MRRVMCVSLPAWPLQRFLHTRPAYRDKPVALSRPARVLEVVVCSRRAAGAGVRPGMPVAEARALAPQLAVHEEEPELDRRALQELAHWAGRYSPIVGLEDRLAAQSLLLDITGCAACFHGEHRLLERAVHEFTEAGWVPRIAVADTVGAAWGLAHFTRTPYLAPPGALEQVLRPLPTAALRLPADLVHTLAQLGIERIDSLLALPRCELPARFGATVLQRLDQALGRQPEVIVPQRAPAAIEAAQAFDYPTDRLDALTYALNGLMPQIERALHARHCAARQVACWLYFLSEPPLCIQVGLYRPRQCPDYLGHLLRAQLEQVRLREAIRAVRLRVLVAEPLTDHQTELFATEPGGLEMASALVDYLSIRLGTGAVTQAQLVPDFQPEFACCFEPLIPATTERRVSRQSQTKSQRRPQRERWPEALPCQPLRPLCLWPQPVGIEVLSIVPDGPPCQLHWAGQSYRITHSWGPERIETGWWRGPDQDVQRDYYVIDTDRATRLWIFRSQQDGRWFLHGCFD
jgi:protein ImuB